MQRTVNSMKCLVAAAVSFCLIVPATAAHSAVPQVPGASPQQGQPKSPIAQIEQQQGTNAVHGGDTTSPAYGQSPGESVNEQAGQLCVGRCDGAAPSEACYGCSADQYTEPSSGGGALSFFGAVFFGTLAVSLWCSFCRVARRLVRGEGQVRSGKQHTVLIALALLMVAVTVVGGAQLFLALSAYGLTASVGAFVGGFLTNLLATYVKKHGLRASLEQARSAALMS